jgi:photosystem II stability/assembly factor-like uncharacterized protein
MPNYTADQIITYKHGAPYIQFGDARPDHPVVYAALGGQPVRVEGLTVPEAGEIEPIYIHNPRRIGSFTPIGSMVTAPDLPEATLVFLEKHRTIPRQLARLGCLTTYIHYGVCKDLSDRAQGWENFIEVLAHGRATEKDLGDRTAWGDSDDQHEDSVTVRLEDYFLIGSLSFGEKAGPEVEREVMDLVYASNTDCVSCDTPEVYTDRLYALTKSSGAASPGTTAEVIYTTDGGATWSQVSITGLGATVDPDAIDVVGNFLVVVVAASGGYYYAPINQLTGVPGSWTLVTTGFVASKQPNDLFVLNANEVFFVGEGGYIYKSTDITAGVTAVNAGVATTSDLKRIHGNGDTLVAVGESGAIVRSKNRGQTWATTTLSPTSATVRAIAVVTERIFWIGTSGGKVYWTGNGGETWTESTAISGDLSTGAVIDDIVFVNRHVGWIVGRTSTPTARLFSTWDGGVLWTRQPERLVAWPTFARGNRIAAPYDADSTTAANNVAVGGLSAGGTDGVLFQGVGNRV